jgi:peptidoglycan-N-acetylglucosamine deacetylase
MRLWRVRPVRPGALLQFGVSPYRGRTTVLADGTRVQTGDRILHVHLDNRRLASAQRSNPWELVDMVRRDLDVLSEEVASGRLGEVKAVRGVTVLARAATRAGFEIRPLPHTLRWALIRQVLALVVAAYHPHGIRELDRGLPWPGEVWMSSQTLQARAALNEPLTG